MVDRKHLDLPRPYFSSYRAFARCEPVEINLLVEYIEEHKQTYMMGENEPKIFHLFETSPKKQYCLADLVQKANNTPKNKKGILKLQQL